MNGLSDSLTIGILLVLIFGAVAFYLYSRLTQNEKRMGLLENLLLSLKMNTEASLSGPDMVEPIGGAEPLLSSDVEDVNEEEYAEMLQSIPSVKTPTASSVASKEDADDEDELLRSVASVPVESSKQQSLDANYESMTVKELVALAKQRGLTGLPQRKTEIIELLKKSGSAPTIPTPLVQAEGELEGVETGFQVSLDNN
jgi:hypothetical protein